MLSALTDVKSSAGYVALERVTGSLDGKSGSFVLQHSGTMTRGAPQLTITVVPDSGTGELSGLRDRNHRRPAPLRLLVLAAVTTSVGARPVFSPVLP